MNRADITELHFITPIGNVPSILEYGVLSNRIARRLDHDSVALEEVQERRRNKQIPGGGKLHEYANLYFDAHNAMLSRRRAQNDIICVLRVSSDVLELPDVVLSDRNAASDWARFSSVAAGLEQINGERVFARYWTHDDPFDQMSHKSEKCAEVLVPGRVDACHITGAYVANQVGLTAFNALNTGLPVSINTDIFFY
ncbi:MAG: DUF4433 domain-containing protein [Verrucomicrobia bacterium]|nr:DUF4433 domain-containing protein [Verrucomicrobiota bacterium]